MEKQKNRPALRFPEFTSEWEIKKLGELFKISAGGDIPSENVKPEKDEIFKYPIYANAEKNKGFYGYSDIYRVEENVITVAGRGVNIGIAHARNHKFYPIVRLLVLRPIKSENIYFFEYQINRLNLFKESTGVPQLTAPQVSGYEVFYPQLPEQTKIATFLTAVDNKLNQLKKKKTLLEQYKKGLMQKIFDQEIRFKDDDGKEFPEWEVNKIKEYIDFLSGFAFKGEDISEDSSGIPLLRGVSITEGKLRRSDEIDRFYCGEIAKINKYFLIKGDIVIGMDGSKVGKNSALVDSNFDNALLVQRVARIRGTSKGFLPFIYHHINSSLFHRYVDEVKTSSGIPHISATQINDFKINFPCYQEQLKIANFLSAIDEKLKRTENQIQQTEQYKKGLLQEMFV